MTPSPEPTPTPALAPALSPPEDVNIDDDDGDVFAAEDVDACDVFGAEGPEACDVLVLNITVEDVGEVNEDGVDEAGEAVVVVAGQVDVGTAQADVAHVVVIGRESEADEE